MAAPAPPDPLELAIDKLAAAADRLARAAQAMEGGGRAATTSDGEKRGGVSGWAEQYLRRQAGHLSGAVRAGAGRLFGEGVGDLAGGAVGGTLGKVISALFPRRKTHQEPDQPAASPAPASAAASQPGHLAHMVVQSLLVNNLLVNRLVSAGGGGGNGGGGTPQIDVTELQRALGKGHHPPALPGGPGGGTGQLALTGSRGANLPVPTGGAAGGRAAGQLALTGGGAAGSAGAAGAGGAASAGGAAIAGLGTAAAVVTVLVVALKAFHDAVRDAVRAQHAQNMQYADFSAAMGAVQAAEEMATWRRNRQIGDQTATTARWLSQAKTGYDDRSAQVEIFTSNLKNILLTVGSGMTDVLLLPLSRMAEDLNQAVKKYLGEEGNADPLTDFIDEARKVVDQRHKDGDDWFNRRPLPPRV